MTMPSAPVAHGSAITAIGMQSSWVLEYGVWKVFKNGMLVSRLYTLWYAELMCGLWCIVYSVLGKVYMSNLSMLINELT